MTKQEAIEKKGKYENCIIANHELNAQYDFQIEQLDIIINAPESVFELMDGYEAFLLQPDGEIETIDTVSDYMFEFNEGMIFLKEEDAKAERAYRQTKFKIRDWQYNHDKGFVVDFRNVHQYKAYAKVGMKGEFHCVFGQTYQTQERWQYFSSAQKLEDCIEHVGWNTWRKDIFK